MIVQEKTQPQVLTAIFGDYLANEAPSGWYTKVRKMRKDPTIALARDLAMAPVLIAPWSVEAEDDAPEDAREWVDSIIQPMRSHILRHTMSGLLDFGWQAFEKVFKRDELSGLITIHKLKPLLQDLTCINVRKDTGAFIGVEQDDAVKLGLESTLLMYHQVEGTNWYGESIMGRAENAYDSWNVVDGAATRFDKKIAGAHWVVHYPPGTTDVGTEAKDNFDLAKDILSSLQSSGQIVVPKKVGKFVDSLNEESGDAWKIELISAQGVQAAPFLDRQKYLDALKVRAFGLPERAVLEGQFGTKAEAEAHGSFAINNMELRHADIVQLVNWHLVNQLLRFNWGKQAENLVRVVPAPISDESVGLLKEIYRVILSSPDGFLAELDSIDLEALKDRLKIPVAQETDDEASTETLLGRLFNGLT